jgi:hypothetical protein
VVAAAIDPLFLGALVFVGLSAHHFSGGGTLGTLRAPATAWVAIAAYLEVKGDVFDASWLWWLAAIGAWAVYEISTDNGDAVTLAVVEVLCALAWAILIPFLWLMAGKPHPTSRNDDLRIAPANAESARGLHAVPPPTQLHAPEPQATERRAE